MSRIVSYPELNYTNKKFYLDELLKTIFKRMSKK